MDKAIITCAVTGVLTDPQKYPVPVTVEEMAEACKGAYNAGAAIMHVHFRCQQSGKGHLPSWEPEVAADIVAAIRQACPEVIINMSTGVIGSDVSSPINCLKKVKPEIAACNAGTLNYLKTRKDGSWAWPPMVFDNPVKKIQQMLEAMAETNTTPEFECFDVGIVRSIGLYVENGMAPARPHYNFVMGVASGMPTDPELLQLLVKYRIPDTFWQVTAIGRREVWPLHQRAAELGGSLRTGLEDTFYLPNGEKARSNAELIEALVTCAQIVGREIASPAEVREMM
ncbi:3-keto-5-aminohexanoate cleavage protein [Endozoicomonas sp. SM1973]|uniref:3-keto-5-aminohexanoate cleavage protein n=1 Tax=Spartinivicinus marinus TaxID=2994442 RepID=A0A853IJ34_9GAMM|nr:3-keto-5-aminohexanoate cleavage protein [Spartinivicinus marinus]MCX4028682.1 3-keto-5-aminohexanoate cleavage protein [Spartinivicinus marinus]NYZ69095.1 3-keto-5-aminohexanoate cleavage protein [Spartinivicinus marinus]